MVNYYQRTYLYPTLVVCPCSTIYTWEKEIKSSRGGLALLKMPWRRAIFDESHTYVNPKSMLFYSIMCIFAERKIALTGTPITNYSSDMYAQLRAIGYNRMLSHSHFKYNI